MTVRLRRALLAVIGALAFSPLVAAQSATTRDRLVWELKDVMNKIGPASMTDQEIADVLAIMGPVRNREFPENVIHLKPRALRNRKQPARA